jgi:hypothetical protein
MECHRQERDEGKTTNCPEVIGALTHSK